MFRPLRDNILVKPLAHTRSEILVVIDNDKEQRGEIIAKGPKANSVSTGDKIRFGTAENYLSFPRLKLGQETFLLMSEKDVCFIEE